jgi:hypothetical protein
LSLNLYFSWHTVEAFTPTLTELFSRSDVFVNEHGWKSGRVEYEEHLYNKLSKGKVDPAELIKKIPDNQTDPVFYEMLYGLIFRSRKKILLERSPLTFQEAITDLTPIEFGNVTVDQKLQIYERNLRQRAAYHRRRDDRFASLLHECCRVSPGSDILAMRGSMHQRPLEKFLTDRSVRFATYLSHSPLPLHLHLEIVSKLEVGDNTNRRELLTALVEHKELSSGKYDLKTMKMADLMGIQNGLAGLSDTEMEQQLS